MLAESPPPKKTKKNSHPPHCKILGFFSGEKGCKDNFNLPPPQEGGWRLDGERSEFSPYRARPSHQSSKWEQKMDIAMGGDPRGGPLFPPKGKGQKNSCIAPCESKQKNIFLQSIFQRKISFFTESIWKTKNKNSEKNSWQFSSAKQKKCKRFSKQVQKNKMKNLSGKFFFGFSRKMKIQFLHSFKKTVKARQ